MFEFLVHLIFIFFSVVSVCSRFDKSFDGEPLRTVEPLIVLSEVEGVAKISVAECLE